MSSSPFKFFPRVLTFTLTFPLCFLPAFSFNFHHLGIYLSFNAISFLFIAFKFVGFNIITFLKFHNSIHFFSCPVFPLPFSCLAKSAPTSIQLPQDAIIVLLKNKTRLFTPLKLFWASSSTLHSTFPAHSCLALTAQHYHWKLVIHFKGLSLSVSLSPLRLRQIRLPVLHA